MSPRVVLVGLPGAGKSTTGRRLAKILCVPFADSDDLIEAATGRGVREIFATSGEPEFRTIEAAAIADAVADFEGVLSLGGGALGNVGTREVLASVPVVLLRASLDTLGGRVGDGHTRPLLAADPAGRLAALADEREPLYREVATITVDTDGKTPGQVAATIAARLHERRLRSESENASEPQARGESTPGPNAVSGPEEIHERRLRSKA